MNSSLSGNLTATEKAALIERWQHVNAQLQHIKQPQNTKQNLADPFSTANQDVTLVAVSKTKPAEMIATLAKQGQTHFGENYLQEALEKIEQLHAQRLQVVWHYIGHIQRNKTRDIAENFAWVQTVERFVIAKRLNDQRPKHLDNLKVLIQVNIDDEDSKSGCKPNELPDLIEQILPLTQLTLRGLMIIPAQQAGKPNTDAFERTAKLFEQIKNQYPQLKAWDTLSMGMSGDIEAAIQSGSTMVRVGTAIFGQRD